MVQLNRVCSVIITGFSSSSIIHHHVRLLRVVIRNRTYKNITVPKAGNSQF